MASESDKKEELPETAVSIASGLARLKSSALKAAGDRERLPQPLFWSLFHAQLESLKREKELRRLVNSIFT